MRGVSGSTTPAKTRVPAESPVLGSFARDPEVRISFPLASMAYPASSCDLAWQRAHESRPRGGIGEPGFESHRAYSPRGVGGYQRLIVEFGAELARMNIGRHIALVLAVTQNATDKLVQSKFLGACYFEQTIHGCAEH